MTCGFGSIATYTVLKSGAFGLEKLISYTFKSKFTTGMTFQHNIADDSIIK